MIVSYKLDKDDILPEMQETETAYSLLNSLKTEGS